MMETPARWVTPARVETAPAHPHATLVRRGKRVNSSPPLLAGKKDKVHDSILIEFYSHENPFPWTASLDYRIIRKGKYKYIRWIRFEDEAELYDLEADPFELNNLVREAELQPLVQNLKQEMRKLVLRSLGLND